MSETAPEIGAVPTWTLGDRMRKAREYAGLRQSGLADDVGIARSSVVNYETDKTEPSRPVLLSWSMRTGVSLRWLRDGIDPTSAQHSGGFRTGRTLTGRDQLGLAA